MTDQTTPETVEVTQMIEHLRQLARKQEGYGMSFSDPGPARSASINLYGDRARAAIWLFKNADRIADALAHRPAGEPVATYKAFTDGMEAAAQICGSLAETTYDDTDAFEAATGCEAAIMSVVRQQRNEQAEITHPAPVPAGELVEVRARLDAAERVLKTPSRSALATVSTALAELALAHRALDALSLPDPEVERLSEALRTLELANDLPRALAQFDRMRAILGEGAFDG